MELEAGLAYELRSAFHSFLERKGFKITREVYDAKIFGNSIAELENDELWLRFVQDRRVVTVNILPFAAPLGFAVDAYYLDRIVRDSDAGLAPTLPACVAFLEDNYNNVLKFMAVTSARDTQRLVNALMIESALHDYPKWKPVAEDHQYKSVLDVFYNAKFGPVLETSLLISRSPYIVRIFERTISARIAELREQQNEQEVEILAHSRNVDGESEEIRAVAERLDLPDALAGAQTSDEVKDIARMFLAPYTASEEVIYRLAESALAHRT